MHAIFVGEGSFKLGVLSNFFSLYLVNMFHVTGESFDI
jgi:hypothetical protein